MSDAAVLGVPSADGGLGAGSGPRSQPGELYLPTGCCPGSRHQPRSGVPRASQPHICVFHGTRFVGFQPTASGFIVLMISVPQAGESAEGIF